MLRFSLWLSKAVNCIPRVMNSEHSIPIQVALLLKAWALFFCRWMLTDNVTACLLLKGESSQPVQLEQFYVSVSMEAVCCGLRGVLFFFFSTIFVEQKLKPNPTS